MTTAPSPRRARVPGRSDLAPSPLPAASLLDLLRTEGILDKFGAKKEAAQAPPSPAVSGADEIPKLAELRDAGILTEAEFQAKKTELLARM
jgi:hypothetical protein